MTALIIANEKSITIIGAIEKGFFVPNYGINIL